MSGEVRGRIRETVSSLLRLDDELAELAESLPLPLDVDEMWTSRLPESLPSYLYTAIDSVRVDCLRVAVDTLLRAARQSDVSLRQRFLRDSGTSRLEMVKGGVSFPKSKTGNNAERKETPPCSD
jgi:hypothetical protein